MTDVFRDPTGDFYASGDWIPPSGPFWSLVNDYPDDTGASYIENGPSAGSVLMSYANPAIPADATNISVTVMWYDRKTSTAAAGARPGAMIAGNTYFLAGHDPSYTTWTARSYTFATNPRTGAAWTPAQVNGTYPNNLQALGCMNNDARPSIRFSSFRFRFTYTAPRRALLSWAELAAPDAGARALAAWAELAAPDAPRRALLSWAALEIPDEQRRALLAWAELAAPDSPGARALLAWAALAVRNPHARHDPDVPDIIPESVPRITPAHDFSTVLADNGFLGAPPAPVGLRVAGKIGQSVYQLTRPLVGDHSQSPIKHMQRRRQVIPADPRNTWQLQLRARFGRAVQAWKALTDPERAVYVARAAALPRPVEGLNLWIREYARAHAPEEYADDAEYLRTFGRLPPVAP